MMAVDRSSLPEIGPDPVFVFPQVQKATLSNGLRVWTVEHGGVPVVTMLLLLPVGSAADPPDRPGLAALVGDLLDEGSGGRSALEVHEALARIGAQFDVEVSADATMLALTTLRRFVDRGLALLADMLVRPAFDPHEFSRVRDLRLSRLLQLRRLAPALAERAFYGALYSGHPYGHLALGTEASLRAVTGDEVVAFHRREARPDRTTLIAVGDATHEELVQAAEHSFAAWCEAPAEGAAAGSSAADIAGRPVPAPRLMLVQRPASAQSELRIGHVAAPRATPDYHALLVMNMVLGGQFVSRINLRLRQEKGYTYGARTVFDFRRGPGPFVVQASVQTDATAEAIRDVVAEIRAIRDERPATEDEVQLARAALTRGYPRGFETAEQVARGVAQLALYDLSDDSFTRFIPSVAAVDRDIVTDVARRHLDPDRLATVIVGDPDLVNPSLSSLSLGPAEPLTQDQL